MLPSIGVRARLVRGHGCAVCTSLRISAAASARSETTATVIAPTIAPEGQRRALHGDNLIAGERSRDASAPTYKAHPPAALSHALDTEFTTATHAQVDAAVSAAARAAASYARAPAAVVSSLLRRVASEVDASVDTITDMAHAETALPEQRLRGEHARTTGQLAKFAALVDDGSWTEARLTVGEGVNIRRMLAPVGPVGVFGASNFPLAFSVAGGDTAAALAAGCPVVVKAHPAHPGTSELVAEAVQRAVAGEGLDPGLFSMLHGLAPAVGEALVTHPDLRAVGFTGSVRAGRALFDLANARPRPIPVFAEMGSVNPVVVLPGALQSHGPDAIAAGLTGSFTLGVGQFCTSPGVVFVVDGAPGDGGAPLAGRFIEALARAADAVPPGTMLTAGIRDAFERRTAEACGVDGVKVVTAPRHPDARNTEAGAVVLEVSAAAFDAGHAKLSEEVFGPAVVVVRCDSADEARVAASKLDGQLTASLWASDEELSTATGADLVAQLTTIAGRVIFNGWPTGVEVCDGMNHGGPYPAATFDQTSVGTEAIKRFVRPVCYQDVPVDAALPPELRDANPRGITRKVNGAFTNGPLDIEYRLR